MVSHLMICMNTVGIIETGFRHLKYIEDYA